MTTKDELYIKEYNNLKREVVLNWIELFTLLLVSFLVSLKFLNVVVWESNITPFLIALPFSFAVTLFFLFIKKYQLSITQLDKENLYLKISQN
jgi:hypothetical protein